MTHISAGKIPVVHPVTSEPVKINWKDRNGRVVWGWIYDVFVVMCQSGEAVDFSNVGAMLFESKTRMVPFEMSRQVGWPNRVLAFCAYQDPVLVVDFEKSAEAHSCHG